MLNNREYYIFSIDLREVNKDWEIFTLSLDCLCDGCIVEGSVREFGWQDLNFGRKSCQEFFIFT